jgi:type IV pilus assembly protein PilM
LKSYEEKNSGSKIDGVLLSGGTSNMKGIEEYLSRLIGTTVIKGNPWHGIDTKQSNPKIIADIGPSFAVAIGLAMRGVEEYRRK